MFIAFLIMLREGIEAALIVGIVAGFLRQSGNGHLMPKVWLGVVAAALLCLGLGLAIHTATGEIPQKQQEFVVGIIGLVAVAMLTYMILWMKKAARSMKRQLEDSVQTALNKGGSGRALVGMAFLAVAREGLESVFFLLAVFQQSPSWRMPAGAVAGLAAAVVIGALVYQGGMRLNLAKFFRITGAFLIMVAAGLCTKPVCGTACKPLYSTFPTSCMKTARWACCSAAFSATPTTLRREKCWCGCCICFP